MLNAIPNSLESPLYSDAVYGIRKINTIIDAPIFSGCDANRFPKNCGMVAESRCWLMILVRLPRITQASNEPMIALPIPAHVAETPYFQPNCPAYPTNTTAEK